MRMHYANTMDSQEMNWRHFGRSRCKAVMEFSCS